LQVKATVLQHILPFMPAKPRWQEAMLRPSEETLNPRCSASNSVSGLKWLPMKSGSVLLSKKWWQSI